jgi:DNA-binding response OmpR family regulator
VEEIMSDSKKVILVVDDEDDILSALNETLHEHYTVFSAANGKEAIEMTDKISPDLIILDILMPVMDGFEACRRIKKNRATVGIPILMLTAKGQMEDTLKGFGCGADSYMIKPFSPEKLLQKIPEMIDKAEIRRSI